MRILAVGLLLGVVCAAWRVAPPEVVRAPSGLAIEGVFVYVAPALVRLKAAAYAPKAGLIWRVTPRKGVQRATTSAELCQFVAPPGLYEVDLLEVSSDDKGTNIREVSVTVEIKPAGSGKEPDPVPPGKGLLDPAKATCRVSFGTSGCTATICGPQRKDGRWDVLTASHCTAGIGTKGKMQLPGTGAIDLTITGRWTRPDITWMVATIRAEQVPYAMIAKELPEPGTKVWHCGFGVDKPNNTEHGVVTGPEAESGQLSFKLSVSSGDSGSGIFRADTGELVGVVCCTTGRGKAVTMYGGSCVQANRLRPVSSSDHGIIPVRLPLVLPDPASTMK